MIQISHPPFPDVNGFSYCCPKCGEITDWIYLKCEWHVGRVAVGGPKAIDNPEHLRWSCPRCGYSFTTKPKDH